VLVLVLIKVEELESMDEVGERENERLELQPLKN
jgi:hypothetical protein